jgi:hypothetical protein
MKQKHFMDIENLREEDTELRMGNGHGFEKGDIISITEKIDGSNFSVTYDTETQQIACFSRKQQLSYNNTLSGAWNYAQALDPTPFAAHPTWRVFGEWSQKNKIRYDERFKNKWIVYDIYDIEKEEWMRQDIVKQFCKESGLEYIHELYYGPFISWDHCKTFLNSPAYGDRQEGEVIKNETKLNNPNTRLPFYLKIVNEDFKESMKTREKVIDPEVENAKNEAQRIVESIVTRNRVEKELFKMRDEGIVPEKLQPKDMKLIAQTLPKRIYDDCIKEEKELVMAAGEYFGKMCNGQVMKFAREIVVGG